VVQKQLGNLQHTFSLIDINQDGEIGPFDLREALTFLGFGQIYSGDEENTAQVYESMSNLVSQLSHGGYGTEESKGTRLKLGFREILVVSPCCKYCCLPV